MLTRTCILHHIKSVIRNTINPRLLHHPHHQHLPQHPCSMLSEGVRSVESDISKSAEDKRSYCGLELNNGLKILLISDPSTDKSAAALDVHVGHLLDPAELPGLAHFCEHMLFLGTEKYPEENEYIKYIVSHGGAKNASTSMEHTRYHFDVGTAYLEGALDRFAGFFTGPLFTESATDREVNAVNSENDKNVKMDSRRRWMLQKTFSREGHDYSKFSTGNKDTLDTIPKASGINVRDELLKFHEKHYSANIMCLTVLGKESLEELQNIVVPLFAGVENKDVPVAEWAEHPYGPDQLQRRAHIVPVKDLRILEVIWPIPDLSSEYASQPGSYLAHLIGHEGPGSLLVELKSRGWANTLSAGSGGGAKGFDFFEVSVDLSEEGDEHTDDVITLIFQYLNLLRQSGPQERVFREYQDIRNIKFRFKDKETPVSYVSSLSRKMHSYPLREVLTGGMQLQEYRPDLITSLLDQLTADRCRVMVVGQAFIGKTTSKERWYGTDYSDTCIPKQTITTWQSAGLHPSLTLPAPNDVIPDNFELAESPDVTSLPRVLRSTTMGRLWYKQDDKYLLPKAYINVELVSPVAYHNPLNTALTCMFTRVLNDVLNVYTYDAELAGLHYGLSRTDYGLELQVRGFNDKLHILLEKIMAEMTNLKIDPQRFYVLKEKYVRSLKNFDAEQPWNHAVYYSNLLTCEQKWSKTELLQATEEVTVESLQSFVSPLLSRVYLEVLVYGNCTKQHASKLADIVETSLVSVCGSKALVDSQLKRHREVILPAGSSYVYKQGNEVHKLSACLVYYQCGVRSTHDNMLVELFCQIIYEPCFVQLRTVEQLGYIVFRGVRRQAGSGCQGVRVIVQSDRDPEYVEGRVEAFIMTMQDHISHLTEAELGDHVNALATKRLEQPKQMQGQQSRYWSEIEGRQYNFDRANIEVNHLKTLTKDDILNFYNSLIAEGAPHRSKLSIHIASTQSQAEQQESDSISNNGLTEPITVEDVNEFKRGLGLYPLPEPVIELSSSSNDMNH